MPDGDHNVDLVGTTGQPLARSQPRRDGGSPLSVIFHAMFRWLPASTDMADDCVREGEVPVTTVVMFVRGLTRVMSAVTGVRRIDCVADGDELLSRYTREPADLVLVGTQRGVPTAVATRRLVAAHPQANVIMFGVADDAGGIAAAIAGGARLPALGRLAP